MNLPLFDEPKPKQPPCAEADKAGGPCAEGHMHVARAPATWLIGENNPYGPDPENALYPYPPGCAGARLCVFLDLTNAEYLRRFRRRNLLSVLKWSVPIARQAADDFLLDEVVHCDRLVLLGAKVARAFGYDFEPLKRHFGIVKSGRTQGPPDPRGYRVLIAPHPSGLSRAWNDPTMPARLREALAALEAR